MSYNIYEIKDIYSLIYHMERRIKQLLIDDSTKHQVDAMPCSIVEIVEDELQPTIEKLMKAFD
jgi:hypothetical protein